MKTKIIIFAVIAIFGVTALVLPNVSLAEEAGTGSANLIAQLSSMLESISNTLQSLTISVSTLFESSDEEPLDAALMPLPVPGKQILANLHPIITKAAVPAETKVRLPVNLTVVSYDPTGDAYVLKVDWGDGSSSTVISYPKVRKTNTQNLSHVYSIAKTHQINVRVIDSDEKQGGDAQV